MNRWSHRDETEGVVKSSPRRTTLLWKSVRVAGRRALLADLADAAQDRFAKGGGQLRPLPREHGGRGRLFSIGAAPTGRRSSLKDCFRVALGAQDVQRRHRRVKGRDLAR